jgi:uncharacterized protein YegP (UPF0339 family)
MPTFQHYQDAAREWRWRLVADNGRIVADSGEGYRRKEDSEAGAKLFQRHSPAAPVRHIDREGRGGRGYEWEIYEDASRDRNQPWRWRFQAGNNRTLADSAEGYESRANCERAVAGVKTMLRQMNEEEDRGGGRPGGGYTPPTGPSNPGRGRFA